jgi:hypothetical protein
MPKYHFLGDFMSAELFHQLIEKALLLVKVSLVDDTAIQFASVLMFLPELE